MNCCTWQVVLIPFPVSNIIKLVLNLLILLFIGMRLNFQMNWNGNVIILREKFNVEVTMSNFASGGSMHYSWSMNCMFGNWHQVILGFLMSFESRWRVLFVESRELGCCLALYPKFTWKQTFLLYSETLLLEYCWMYTSWTNTLNKFVLGQRFVFQGWMSTKNKVSVTMDVSQVFDILNVRIIGSWDQNEENKNINYEIIHNLKILNLRTITYIACMKYLIV